jgi:antitoxin MazE
MRVKVAKWGNSLGVRLPKAAADAVGLSAGTDLDVVVKEGELRLLRRARTSGQLLEEMIAEMKRLGPEAEPETVEWGPDVGSEILPDDAYSRGEITLDDLLGRTPKKSAKRQKSRKHAAPRRRRHRVG